MRSARLQTIVTDYETALSRSGEHTAVTKLIAYAEGLEELAADRAEESQRLSDLVDDMEIHGCSGA